MSSRLQEKQDLSMLEASHFYLMRTISPGGNLLHGPFIYFSLKQVLYLQKRRSRREDRPQFL